jgi:hypothetical protein
LGELYNLEQVHSIAVRLFCAFTSTIMHSAWLIQDIQLLVFEHLHQQDLANLAQTCRALLDPTTSHLWKTLTSLQPLVSCLPQKAKDRKLVSEDLDRLDFYSSKTQTIHLVGDETESIKVPKEFRKAPGKKGKIPWRVSWIEFWEEVAAVRSQTNFLPNLRHLRVNYTHEEVLIPFVGISGANIEELYIKYLQYRRKDSVVRRMLDQFDNTARLEYLFVRNGAPDVIPPRIIEQSPLKRLRLVARMEERGGYERTRYQDYTIPPAVFNNSTISNLSLGLNCDWYPLELDKTTQKYLSSLRILWLNLIPFTFSECEYANGTGIKDHGWICQHLGGHTFKNPCKRRSPADFFERLDNPELQELNITFPVETTTGAMYLEVVRAVKNNCRLLKLKTLSLGGGGYTPHCWECDAHPDPEIMPRDLTESMKILSPLPQLQKLKLSAAPNFLGIGVPDLPLYELIAKGLPSLEVLWLGSRTFTTFGQFAGTRSTESVPLRNLAAFCSLLPNLMEVEVGTIDPSGSEKTPEMAWQSPHVQSLVGHYWKKPIDFDTSSILKSLVIWFPNCDLVTKEMEGMNFL